MTLTEVENEIQSFIDSDREHVEGVMAQFDSEANPGTLLTAFCAFGDEFVSALAGNPDSEFCGLQGEQKKDKLGKILDIAAGLVMAGKVVKDMVDNSKKPSPTPDEQVVVKPETNAQPEQKIMGLPKGIFILLLVVVLLLGGYVAVSLLKKK